MRHIIRTGDSSSTISIEKWIPKVDHWEIECRVEDKLIKRYLKCLRGEYYISPNNKIWRHLPKTSLAPNFSWLGENINYFRGYIPSGMGESGSGTLVTQMPGKVIKLMVEKGDEVKKGQTLLILEAMKMENEIKSAVDGTVQAIHVKTGQALDQGVTLMEIE
jgi:hypothetical protein